MKYEQTERKALSKLLELEEKSRNESEDENK